LILSLGPSRADPLEGVGKMEKKAGDVLRVFLDETLKSVFDPFPIRPCSAFSCYTLQSCPRPLSQSRWSGQELELELMD
jgi:hypothetical protein